ncbi:MAG: hypothetical protein ACKO56_02490 [Paracoccaceae bacterium]
MTPAGQDSHAETAPDRAIWSFALLLGVLVAGFALALSRAEVSPALVHTLSALLN